MFSIANINATNHISIHGKIGKMYQTLIKEIINTTLYKERVKSKKKIEVIIENKEKMQEHNAKCLNKIGPTDIISIEFDSNKEEYMLGTIILCPQIIKEDSLNLNKEYVKHLTHLIVHGTLHLLGYTHDLEESQKQMEAREVNVLSFLGIESPYINQSN